MKILKGLMLVAVLISSTSVFAEKKFITGRAPAKHTGVTSKKERKKIINQYLTKAGSDDGLSVVEWNKVAQLGTEFKDVINQQDQNTMTLLMYAASPAGKQSEKLGVATANAALHMVNNLKAKASKKSSAGWDAFDYAMEWRSNL